MNQAFMKVLENNTIYQVITGSTSYGLTTKTSDIDQKAIVILPAKYILNLSKEWETETLKYPDLEFHSLKKAMNLFSTQNPTMLETLFVENQYIVKETKYSKELKKSRNLFLTQNCYNSFGGYAKDQLMKIKNALSEASKEEKVDHLYYKLNGMINQMKSRYPTLNQGKLLINKNYQEFDYQNVLLNVNFKSIPLRDLSGITSELANSLKHVNNGKKKTKLPIDKLSKHAMHLIRLLLMGIEVLEEGKMTVCQSQNRDFLLSIRNGKYSWREIFNIAEELFNKLEQAREKSILPKITSSKVINELFYDVVSSYYGINGS